MMVLIYEKNLVPMQQKSENIVTRDHPFGTYANQGVRNASRKILRT